MKRIAVLFLMLVLFSGYCGAFELVEFGFQVNIDRLATVNSNTGKWHASVEAYLQMELDAIWRIETGIGFDFARLAPSGSIGFLRAVLDEMYLESDLVLQWIPRHGIVATIDTGIRYSPQISETGRLIVETYPIQWQIISIDHRYFPIPEFNLSLTIGGALLLDQGGFFGEIVTIEAYKIEDRRLPFSLFVGNGWFLTAGQLTTRFGYRL